MFALPFEKHILPAHLPCRDMGRFFEEKRRGHICVLIFLNPAKYFDLLLWLAWSLLRLSGPWTLCAKPIFMATETMEIYDVIVQAFEN